MPQTSWPNPGKKKEAFAIQFGTQHFRVYLLGRKFTISTDHSALSWLHSMEPKGRIARWLMDLQEFDFEVKHRAGRVHNNADALSRLRPTPELIRKLQQDAINFSQDAASLRQIVYS